MSTLTLDEMHTNAALQRWADAEARRLRDCLDELNPVLEQLIDVAAAAHARYRLAEQAWSNGGCRPDDPWLKAARDALRDYQATLRLLLKHSNAASVDPLRL